MDMNDTPVTHAGHPGNHLKHPSNDETSNHWHTEVLLEHKNRQN